MNEIAEARRALDLVIGRLCDTGEGGYDLIVAMDHLVEVSIEHGKREALREGGAPP